ncbi:MAG: hypothetical protein HYT81_03260 [Gemmatimonadetes bacterium]|nr:hypothetical protein [Gemmatimonadota bacterium]
MTLANAGTTAAQFPQWSTFPLTYVDARVLPRGQLQVGFLPSYAHYDTRFDSSGMTEPLGRYLSPDTAGTNFLPSLTAAELAVRSITGDSSYRMSLGNVSLPLDADARRFPFDFSLGLTNWLTLGVRVPLVKTRVQGVLAVDTTDANVGWNQAAAAAGTGPAAAEIAALLSELDAAIGSLEAQITAGRYGCPSSAQCAAANALWARATRLRDALVILTGAPGQVLPPTAPLASSAAGLALRAEIKAVADSLAALGAGTVSATLPLPAARLDSADLQTVVTDPVFGYDLLPLATPKRIYRLGDVEVFLRIGLLRGSRLRAVLTTGVRLPTGYRQHPTHLFNLGTGDQQLDLEGGAEFAWEPGRLGLSGTAMYTHQFADQLSMRWASPERPMALAAYEYLTDRQLGDVFRAAVYPSLRLSEGFQVYGSAYYFHKAADSYALPATGDPLPGTPAPEDVARGSGGQSWSLGAGIAYRATRPQRDTTGTLTALPVEAGLSYQAAFSGSGGLVPKSTMLHLYLRFHAKLF